MGEVIAFQTRAKPSRHGSEPPTGDAQILFFLGVRYTRTDEPQDSLDTFSPDHDHHHGPRGGKKRKSRTRA